MAWPYYYDNASATTWGGWNTIAANNYTDWCTTTTAAWAGWNNVWLTGTAANTTVTTGTGGVRVGGNTVNVYEQQILAVPQPTAEERERLRLEREERERQYQEARERERLEREAAKARAEALLVKHLSVKQRREFKSERAFTVISVDGQRRYRIREAWSGNVDLVGPEGQRLKRYCIHPRETCPEADNMLAQKLMLEHCEPEFLRLANAS